MIEKVRAEKDPDKRRKLKAKLLPYFTFSHFGDNKRDNAHFKFTKFILVDIDHVGVRLEGLKKAFRSDSHIVLFFVSPSGDGLKVEFALKEFITDKHFQNLMKQWYGVEPDKSTVDSSRCCFLSSDPDLFVNWNPICFDIPDEKEVELEAKPVIPEKKGDSEILQLMKGVVEPGRHLATTRLASFYKNKGMDYVATLEYIAPL
jgi:hypothetical protein